MLHQKINTQKNKHIVLRKRETRTGWLFLLPSFAGILIFILIPFADAVRRAFYKAMGNQFVGLENFKTVFANTAFQLAARNTGRFLITCIPMLLVISLLLSVMIYGQKKSGNYFKTTFLIPLAIPVASVAILWRVFFHEKGLVNHLLSLFQAPAVDWMNTSNAFYVLVFTYLWKNTGYDMVLWTAGLEGISTALYEAASIDGAGAWSKFRYITLPELIPTLFVATVLSFVNSFKVFREAYLAAGNYPDKSIYMLQHLFNNWFIKLDLQRICAAAVIMAIILMAFILLMLTISRRKE